MLALIGGWPGALLAGFVLPPLPEEMAALAASDCWVATHRDAIRALDRR